MSEVSPELSVIVASTNPLALAELLHSLEKQSREASVEIIVATAYGESFTGSRSATYPFAQFIRFPEKTILPVLWGAGIAQAKGQIIAITDTTCELDDEWIAAILETHKSSHPVIGGAVEVRGRRTGLNWAAYFCEYGQFMRPLTHGIVTELPGNNLSFKRRALDIGREFVTNGFWKSYWCQRLQQQGLELYSDPTMIIYDKKTYQFMPFLVRRFHHGRCFAGMRIVRLSAVKRFLYLLLSPLLPLLFLKRLIFSILPKHRYRKELLLTLPFSVLAIVSWSVGEFCGYLAGADNSCSHIH